MTPVIDRTTVLTDNSARREFGKQHMSAVVIWLLAQNNWSHPILEELSTWALDEEGAMHTSQVSHIRNGRMRMLGVKTIDSFGAINLGVWAYHNDRKFLKQMGTATLTSRIEELLKDAKPIMYNGEPIDAGGWMNLYLGYIQIEGVVGGVGSASTESAAKAIGQYIEKAVKKSGKEDGRRCCVDRQLQPRRAHCRHRRHLQGPHVTRWHQPRSRDGCCCSQLISLRSSIDTAAPRGRFFNA